jgi:hypothetical protein
MSHHSSTIRKLRDDAKKAFQELKDAVKGPGAGQTGTQSKPEAEPEGKPSTDKARFAASDFISAKCDAAIELLDAGAHSARGDHSKKLEKLVDHLKCLFREIVVAYRAEGSEKYDEQLEAVNHALRRLSWAQEGENRLALVEICESARNLKEAFKSVEEGLKEENPLWQSSVARSKSLKSAEGRSAEGQESKAHDKADEEEAYSHDGDATAVVNELCALCDECEHGATAAIEAICDSDKLRALTDNVCRVLTGIQEHHDHLRCVLHLRDCEPGMQPPQSQKLLANLEHSGADVARLVRAGHQLKMKQPDLACELRENWQSLRECMEHVRDDLVHWGECQCAAPEGCFKGVDALIALAAQGSKLVESSSSICCETLSGVCKLADDFYVALSQFDCQLEKLNDFPEGATGCCWWKLARIQLICHCPPAEDCCSELKTEVTRLMEQFQRNKPESPSELMKAVNVGKILQLAMECFGRAARSECVGVCTHPSSGTIGKKDMPAISLVQATSQTKLAQYWAKSDELCQRMAQCPELAGFTTQWARYPSEQTTFLEAHGDSLPGAIEMSQARRQNFITAGNTALSLIEASVPSARRDPITKLRIQFEEQSRAASV